MLQTRDWSTQAQSAPFDPLYSFHPDQPALGNTEKDVASFDLWTSSADAEWVDQDRQIERFLVKLFESVPKVHSIYLRREDETTRVWTLREDYDRDARDAVYDQEIKICEAFRLSDFDFRVTSKDLVDGSELERTGSRRIFRRH